MLVGIVGLASFASGCGANRELSTGIKAYERGNYNQAADRCDRIEGDDWNDKRQVRYLVYCGLAFYQVGRHDSAKEMLESGRSMYSQGDRRWLKPGIVDQLYKTLDSLSGSSGRSLVGASETKGASFSASDSSDAPSTVSRHIEDRWEDE